MLRLSCTRIDTNAKARAGTVITSEAAATRMTDRLSRQRAAAD
jgi:hypothetical protein